MNHNAIIWFLQNATKKMAPIEWAERCGLRGIDWSKWDRFTTTPCDYDTDFMGFAESYQKYNWKDLVRA